MDQKTHFQLVGEFHDAFDYPQRKTCYMNCFDEKPDLVKKRIKFMSEELDEFKLAYAEFKPVSMADALCDLAYFAHGTGQCMGIDIDLLLSMRGTRINSDGIDEPSDLNLIEKRKSIIDCGITVIEDKLNKISSAEQSKDINKLTMCLDSIIGETYYFGHRLGFNMDKMFREVHRSNMAKLCPTYEDAVASVNVYLEDPEKRYTTPNIRPKGNYYVVFNKEDNKILKDHKWQEPNLEQFFI